MRALRTVALFLGTMLLFYGIPTLLERWLAPRCGPWAGVVAFGDLSGCACLFAMGLRRLSLITYAGMTGLEAALLGLRLVAPLTLAWVADLVPAALVAVIVTTSASVMASMGEGR